MSDPRWDADLATDGVRRTAGRAVVWSGVSQAGRLILNLSVGLWLATVLDPGDFGLIATTVPIMGFVNALNDIGARSALQREPSLSVPLVTGVFWMNTGLGVLCSIALVLIAWPMAWFYDDPRLLGVMHALSPVFVLTALGLVSLSLLQRRLNQKRLAVIEIGGTLAAAATAIVSALNGAGAYAIVFQQLVGVASLSLMAFLLAPVPAFARWSFADVRPVIRYSVNLALFSAVNALARNADYLLLRHFAGVDATGLYYYAYKLVIEPASQAAGVIARVALPVLAAVQQDAAKLKAGYLKVVGTLCTATFPATIGLLAVRHELIALLGDKWLPVTLLILLLVPVGIFQSILGPLGCIYQVRGRTDLMFRMGSAFAVGLLICLAIGAQWGVVGMAAAYSLAIVLMAWPLLAVPLRLIDLPIGDLMRELARPLVATGVMGLVVWFARPLVAGFPPLAALIALVGVGVAVQATMVLLVDRERLRDARSVFAPRK